MSRVSDSARVMRVLVCLAAVIPASRPANAQTTVLEGFSLYTHAGIGFVVDAPDQLNGVGAFFFGPRLAGWGLYIDGKRSHETPRDEAGFTRDITVAQAEDQFSDRYVTSKAYWTAINVGVVRVVSGSLAVYGGAGYSEKTGFRRYYDESAERGEFGTYWIEDPSDSGSRVNALLGGLFRASRRLILQFGVESAPRGATVGLYIAQPFSW